MRWLVWHIGHARALWGTRQRRLCSLATPARARHPADGLIAGELLEAVERACRTAAELEVVRALAGGLTLREAGRARGVSKQRAHQMISDVRRRVER